MDYFPVSEELVKSAKSFWEPRYGRKVSDEEAREIIRSFLAFTEMLMEEDDKERCLKDGVRSATEG